MTSRDILLQMTNLYEDFDHQTRPQETTEEFSLGSWQRRSSRKRVPSIPSSRGGMAKPVNSGQTKTTTSTTHYVPDPNPRMTNSRPQVPNEEFTPESWQRARRSSGRTLPSIPSSRGSVGKQENSGLAKAAPSTTHVRNPSSGHTIEEYGPDSWKRPWESKVATPEPVKKLMSQYKTTKRVGGGAFGEIYICVNRGTGEKVAVKFEKHAAPTPQLRHEYKVLRELQNTPGFAKVHYFGKQDSHDILIMDLLGPSLEDQFNKCGRTFSLKTVLMIADQMLARIEYMHSRHLLHRDIKPANFVTCLQKGDLVYCIDFGLSKIYRHPKTLQHIPCRKTNMAGTPRYASINNHLGVQQSRRDDLESIAYVLIYFLLGKLPWQGLGGDTPKDKYRRILERKQALTPKQLCRDLPDEFEEFLSYTRKLKFDEEPKYDYIRGLFRNLFLALGYSDSDHEQLDWDWNRAESQTPTRAAVQAAVHVPKFAPPRASF